MTITLGEVRAFQQEHLDLPKAFFGVDPRLIESTKAAGRALLRQIAREAGISISEVPELKGEREFSEEVAVLFEKLKEATLAAEESRRRSLEDS